MDGISFKLQSSAMDTCTVGVRTLTQLQGTTVTTFANHGGGRTIWPLNEFATAVTLVATPRRWTLRYQRRACCPPHSSEQVTQTKACYSGDLVAGTIVATNPAGPSTLMSTNLGWACASGIQSNKNIALQQEPRPWGDIEVHG
jgi:hypothetical protein